LVGSQRSQDESDGMAAQALVGEQQRSESADHTEPTADAPPELASPRVASASDVSALQRFVDARGIAYGPQAQDVVNEFEALPDDPAWSSSMEVLLFGELARSTLPVADWYVECRRGRCLAILVLATVGQGRQGELPNGAVVREQGRIAAELQLLSVRGWRLTTRYDTLVTLLSFHRRCGPEWKCLE
jgi:hypothetical protein